MVIRATACSEVSILSAAKRTERGSSGLSSRNSAIRSGDQLYVPNKGWISRNPAAAVGFLSVLATVAVIALHR